MKHVLVAAALLATIGSATSARAEGGDFGLGIIFGEPTGLAGKWYLGDSHAIDFAVGFSALGARGVHLHADYLWHPKRLASESKFDLIFYVGVGGRLLSHDRGGRRFRDDRDDTHLGPRVPVGLLFDFGRTGVPFDVFLEAALGIDFIFDDDDRDRENDINLYIHGALGARYYF